MDIQDIQKYRSSARSSNNSESNVTPKTELRHAKKEQLVLGVFDLESNITDKEEDYKNSKKDDFTDNTSDKSKDRDKGALEWIIRRTSQLIEEG